MVQTVHIYKEVINEMGREMCLYVSMCIYMCHQHQLTSLGCPSTMLYKVSLSNSIHGPHPYNVLSAWFELL